MVAPTLLILAAGMGSRYGGLNLIEPVGPDGETIVDYSIYDARRAGFGRFVFVIRMRDRAADPGQDRARFGKRIAVEYVYQELVKLPPGFHVPARPHQAVGHDARHSHGRQRHSRALRGHQCRRFLRSG